MAEYEIIVPAPWRLLLLPRPFEPTLMAQANQTNQTTAARWLAKADLASPFTVPKTRRAWKGTRREVRAQLWQLLGKLPPRPRVPTVRTLSREDKGEYLLEKFEFDNLAGATVPVICSCRRTPPASHQPFSTATGTEANTTWAGRVVPHQRSSSSRRPALVKQGYVVIAIDAYCFGERNGAGPGGPAEKGAAGEMTASKFNLWAGRSLWGMIVRDDLMALDYLCSRPEVDTARVGVTGISMGATRTWWVMALDERLKAGVAVCCLTRYQDLIASEGLKHHGIYYFVPGMLNHFDTEAVVALAAPRPLLFQSGETDGGSPVEGFAPSRQPFAKACNVPRSVRQVMASVA